MDKSFLSNNLIAHRGLHTKSLPENSLGAIQNAINHNFTIEIDIHLLSDGTIVVHHDTDLKESCNKDISLYSLQGEDLKSFHIFDTNFTIPTLDDVLELVNGKIPILIEIKDTKHYKKLVDILIQRLSTYKGEVAIQSYNPLALRRCFKQNKSIKLAYLCSKLEDFSFPPKIIKHMLYNLNFFKLSKATFISVKKDEITPKITKKCKGNIIPWVIVNEDELLSLKTSSKAIIFENFIPKN